MKTSRKNRIIKYSFITAIVFFSSLFVWANWSESTLAEKLPKIDMISYDLSSLKNENSYAIIDKEFNGKSGITACTVNSESKIATLVFNPELISKDEILNELKSFGGNTICLKTFPKKAGCPVAGTREFFGKIKESLKVR